MDYLKFTGFSLLALAAIVLCAKLGGTISVLAVFTVSISTFWRMAPRSMAIAYTAWIALSIAWNFAIRALLSGAPEATAKYTASQVQMAEGFWLLVGMLLLHPLCYGIGKLVARRFTRAV